MSYLAEFFILRHFGVPVFFSDSVFLMSLDGFGLLETLVTQFQAYST